MSVLRRLLMWYYIDSLLVLLLATARTSSLPCRFLWLKHLAVKLRVLSMQWGNYVAWWTPAASGPALALSKAVQSELWL